MPTGSAARTTEGVTRSVVTASEQLRTISEGVVEGLRDLRTRTRRLMRSRSTMTTSIPSPRRSQARTPSTPTQTSTSQRTAPPQTIEMKLPRAPPSRSDVETSRDRGTGTPSDKELVPSRLMRMVLRIRRAPHSSTMMTL